MVNPLRFVSAGAVALVVGALSVSAEQSHGSPSASWTDPETGLTWAGQDSGKDLSWKGATRFCHDLHLSGYSDWRLPSIAEMQRIYDKTVESPGMAGRHSEEPATWHVKGQLWIRAYEWSSDFLKDDRGHNSGYVYYFDFNEGRASDDPTGWPYPHEFLRALCVRGANKAFDTDQKLKAEDLLKSR